MNWISLPVVVCLIADALLFLQGVSIARQPEKHLQWLGRLTALLAVIGLIAQQMLFSGGLLLTPEFGVVIIQGPLSLLLLNILIVALTVGAGWGWHAACLRVESKPAAHADTPNTPSSAYLAGSVRLRWLIIIGLLVGLSSIVQALRLAPLLQAWYTSLLDGSHRYPGFRLLTAMQFVPFNPNDPKPLQIFAYDLRWPPLLIWLSVCLTESILTILRLGSRLWHWWVMSLIVAGQSIWAAPLVASPLSSALWRIFVVVAVLINSICAILLALEWLRSGNAPLAQLPGKRWQQALTVLLAAGLCEAMWVGIFWGANLIPPSPGVIILMIVYLGWTPLLLGVVMRYRERHGMPRPAMALPEHFDRWEIGLIVSLVMVAVSLSFIFYDIAGIGPTIPLLAFFISWSILSEVAAGRLLDTHRTSTVSTLLHTAPGRLSRAAKRLRRAEQQPAGQSTHSDSQRGFGTWLGELISVKTAAPAVFKALLLIALLLALNEVPNAGKTIVQPFTILTDQPGGAADAAGQPASDNLSQSISDRLVNNLGLLNQQLQPDIIIPSPGESGGATIRFVSAGASEGGVDAVLAKNSELEISSVKVPVSLLVAPIQLPVRAALGVRTLSGSLQDEGDRFTLLTASSQGETWKATATTRDRTQAVISTTQELAFNIVSTNPAFATLGMTRSWDAFQSFSQGLSAWQTFEARDDLASLAQAIGYFSDATSKDRSFALAFYRLGLALQRSGQPNAAADSFRASLEANPKFVPAYNALAYTLYNFDEYDYSARSAVVPAATLVRQQARVDEARRRWQEIVLFPDDAVSPADRASAYYGLCLDASKRRLHPLTYYYCQHAEALYGQLSSSLRSDPRIKHAEAAVLNTLGFAISELSATQQPINRLFGGRYVFDNQDWYCRLALYSPDQQSLKPPSIDYALAALRYFDQALALQPDDPEIRCNAASTAYALGNTELMESLRQDGAAHLNRAEQYRLLAKSKAEKDRQDSLAYYRQALEEYQAALDHDPSSIWALNGYAYAYWQWRLDHTSDKLLAEPAPDIRDQAMRYAEQALKLIGSNGPPVDRATLSATLGAVLLSQGKMQEARAQLEQSVEALNQAIEGHSAAGAATARPSFNEIRWELAQAYLCDANTQAEPPTDTGAADIKKASDLLDLIRKDEGDGVFQPFVENDLLKLTCGL